MVSRSDLSRRLGLGVACVVAASICGLAIGSWAGARFFLPSGAISAAKVAVNGGLIGAGLAAGAGLAVAFLLPLRWLMRVTALAATFSLVLLGLAGWVHLRTQSRQQAQLAQAVARLPPFRFAIDNFGAADALAQRRVAYDSASQSLQVNNADGSLCRGPAEGRQQVALLRALRRIELLLLQGGEVCGDLPPTHRLAFQVDDPEKPLPETIVFFSSECAGLHPELRTLVLVAQRTHMAIQAEGYCP